MLSFPMFQKEEIDNLIEESKNEEIEVEDVLGDIMISIPRVIEQAKNTDIVLKENLHIWLFMVFIM